MEKFNLFKSPDEAFFKSVLDQMLEGIQVINSELRYVYVNDAACRHGRKTQKELLGKSMLEVYPSMANTSVFKKICKCLSEGVATRVENQFEYEDGSTGWFDLHIEPINGSVLIRSLDITGAKEAERRLLEKAQQLANKNKELEDFTHIASHDLRAPLRHIASFVGLVEKELRTHENKKIDKWLDYILSGTQRMQALIDDLMKYSQTEREKIQVDQIDLNDVLQNVLLDLSVTIAEVNAQIIQKKLPLVLADRIKIHQVLQNLIENALKFRKSEETPQIRVYSSETESYWKIYIADNGVGIESEYFEQIFKPFQRLISQETVSGSGMGLAICKRIVEHHNGQLSLESVVGDGSVFSFTLPKKRSQDGNSVAP